MNLRDEKFMEFFNSVYPDLEIEKKEEHFKEFVKASEFARFLEEHEEKYKSLREEDYIEKYFLEGKSKEEETEKDIVARLLNVQSVLETYRKNSEKVESSKTVGEKTQILNSIKIHMTEENQLKIDFYIKFMEMHEIISKMKEVEK